MEIIDAELVHVPQTLGNIVQGLAACGEFLFFRER